MLSAFGRTSPKTVTERYLASVLVEAIFGRSVAVGWLHPLVTFDHDRPSFIAIPLTKPYIFAHADETQINLSSLKSAKAIFYF